jgi:hypothetical protein
MARGTARRHAHGAVTQAVLDALRVDRGNEMSLAEIYKAVQSRIGPASESGIRMALQNSRPQTENPRRGFWRLARKK